VKNKNFYFKLNLPRILQSFLFFNAPPKLSSYFWKYTLHLHIIVF